jgi:hemoglobin
MYDVTTREPSKPIPSEVQIKDLVCAFYAKVRNDEELAPIFNQVIADWDLHLDRMCAFWSSVMRRSGHYHGNPMAAHLHLKMVRPEHFERWLDLFARTAHELFSADLSGVFIDRAQNIARSLRMGMFYRSGTGPQRQTVTPPPPGITPIPKATQ